MGTLLPVWDLWGEEREGARRRRQGLLTSIRDDQTRREGALAELESEVKQSGMALERTRRKASADVVESTTTFATPTTSLPSLEW